MNPPLPVSFERAGTIHPAFTPQSQDVLKWNHGELGDGTHSQSNQLPMIVSTVGPKIAPHTLMLLVDFFMGLGRFLRRFSGKPSGRRIMVMSGGIDDGVLGKVMGG